MRAIRVATYPPGHTAVGQYTGDMEDGRYGDRTGITGHHLALVAVAPDLGSNASALSGKAFRMGDSNAGKQYRDEIRKTPQTQACKRGFCLSGEFATWGQPAGNGNLLA